VTYQTPSDDMHNYTEPYLRARIAGALGGRVAEEVVFNVLSTGAENDLQNATSLARQMVTRWGMSERIGPVSLNQDDGNQFLGPGFGTGREHSETLAAQVDQEVRRILEECEVRARTLLTTERHRLEALAEALLREESLDEAEILEVTGLTPSPNGTASATNAVAHPTTVGESPAQ
jgi:cell division protease FtsH